MNKARLLGITVLIIGLAINYYTKHSAAHFISGLLIGLSIGLIITGSLNFKKKN